MNIRQADTPLAGSRITFQTVYGYKKAKTI